MRSASALSRRPGTAGGWHRPRATRDRAAVRCGDVDPELDDDRWLTALVMGGTVFVALTDEAIPQGPLISKIAGVLLLAFALPRLLRGTLPLPPLRGVLLPLAGFATFSLLSLVWSVDPDATALRARHLVMEALLLGALAASWSPRGRDAVALAGALVAGVLAVGFGLEALSPEGARLRPFGLHPNLAARDALLAGLLGTLLSPRLPPWGAPLIAAVAGISVGASFSSGALLASVAVAMVLLADRRWRPTIGGLLLGVVLGSGVLLASAERAPRLRTPATALRGNAVEEVGSGRLVLWGHALRVTAAHPVLGAGAGTFPEAMEPIRIAHQRAGGEHSKPRRRAHNSFLETLAETGLLGLLLFAAPFGWLARTAWRRRNAVAGAFVAYAATASMTDSVLQQKSLWLALGIGALMTGERDRPTTAPPSPPPST